MIPTDVKQTLQALFRDRLQRDPDGRAIAWLSPRAGVEWHSFAEFHARASGVGAALAERGLGAGDTCVLVEVDPELASCLVMGTLLLGAKPLLVAPPTIQGPSSMLGDVVKSVIARTAAPVAFLSQELEGALPDLEAGAQGTRFVLGAAGLAAPPDADLPDVDPSEDDVPAYQLTSGTTGFPRIAMWRQKNVIAALVGMIKAMDLGRDDVFLNWTPLYHDMGLVNNFFVCMASGIPMALQSPLDFIQRPSFWLRGLVDAGATTTWSPNFGFAVAAQRVRDREIEGVRLDHVRGFWNAAERIHAETLDAFLERFGPLGVTREKLKTNFGCVENVGGATFSDPHAGYVEEVVDTRVLQEERIARVVDAGPDAPSTTRLVSAGRPHPDMDIEILDDDGNVLPDGRVGEVALVTPSRLIGFVDDEEATAQTIRGRHVLTGDLGYRRGPEFFWVGRSREKINIQGKKFDPSDFEGILLEIPDLRAGCFAAFGVDDAAAGSQSLVIVSEIKDGISQGHKELCDEVRAGIAQRLGVRVGQVVLVEKGTLAKTSSGKRRHRFFQEQYETGRLEAVYESGRGGARRPADSK